MTVATPGDGTDAIIEKARREGRLHRVDPKRDIGEQLMEIMGQDGNPIEAPAPQVEGKIVDIGPYCVECREDTTGQEGRTQYTKKALEVTGEQDENGDPEVIDILMQGWKCEQCQPFESALIEATYAALVERRYDAQEVRRKMRAIGEEKLWTAFHEPMLDSLEVVLGLEIR